MNNNPVFICWSASQGAARYETMEETLRTNMRAFREGRRNDYVPIAAFETMEAANAFYEQNRAAFERRAGAHRKDRWT